MSVQRIWDKKHSLLTTETQTVEKRLQAQEIIDKGLPPIECGFPPSFEDARDKVITLESSQTIPKMAEFMTKYGEIKELLLEFADNAAENSKRLLHDAFLAQKANERAAQKADDEKSFWDTVGSSVGGILAVVSLCVGAMIISGGTALAAIAGAALIVSGLCSIGGIIMEKAGVKSEVTMGVQIFGAAVGLISGVLGFTMTPDKMALLMRIGTALLTAAAHSADIISYVYQQKSSHHQADTAIYEACLEKDRDLLAKASKLLDSVSDNDFQSEVKFIEAIKKEEQIYRQMIQKYTTAG